MLKGKSILPVRQIHTKWRVSAFAASKAARWLAVMAIAFQCIVVQSHIHVPATLGSVPHVVAVGLDANASNRGDKGSGRAPRDDDTANCFICQQMALAGAALLPVSAAPVLVALEQAAPTVAYHVAVLRTVRSHSWRSRAPPLLI